MQDKEIVKKLLSATKEVGGELALKAEELELQTPDTDQPGRKLMRPAAALQHAKEQTRQMLQFLLQANEGTLIRPSQFESAIDLSLGNILPFTSAQFEDFTRGKGLENPTIKIAFEFRKAMLEKLEQIFTKTKETAS